MKNDLFIVIVGCGRLGVYLANRLSFAGNLLVVIDRVVTTFANLSPDFSGFRIEGDATQIAVLKEAKMNQADWVIATTNNDNVNLMVSQIARNIFNVPHVLARIFDPEKEQGYAGLGIETYCPTSITAQLFLKAITQTKPNSRRI